MNSALAAAAHVRSGKEYWGDPGPFAPTRQAGDSTPGESTPLGEPVNVRCQVMGTRQPGDLV